MTKNSIKYPCTWHYKIIGYSKQTLHLAALELVDKKYHSINLEVEVENQEERDRIFQTLQKDSRIKFVL